MTIPTALFVFALVAAALSVWAAVEARAAKYSRASLDNQPAAKQDDVWPPAPTAPIGGTYPAAALATGGQAATLPIRSNAAGINGKVRSKFKIMKTDNIAALKIADPDTVTDKMLPEYRFDYSKARPNRFVQQEMSPQTVHLDADVAAVFTKEEAVNSVLSALIQTMPSSSLREPV